MVRDLWRRDQGKGLSAGEKRMLAKARQVLVGELALAEVKDEKKADTLLAEVDATIERLRSMVGAGPEVEAKVVEDDDIDIDGLSFDDED